PLKVVRDKQPKTINITVEELNLESENSRDAQNNSSSDDQEQTSKGFGLTLGNVTPEIARRLRIDTDVRGAVITDVEQASPAARAGLQPGDIVLQVNRKAVSSSSQASTELN